MSRVKYEREYQLKGKRDAIANTQMRLMFSYERHYTDPGYCIISKYEYAEYCEEHAAVYQQWPVPSPDLAARTHRGRR